MNDANIIIVFSSNIYYGEAVFAIATSNYYFVSETIDSVLYDLFCHIESWNSKSHF